MPDTLQRLRHEATRQQQPWNASGGPSITTGGGYLRAHKKLKADLQKLDGTRRFVACAPRERSTPDRPL